MTEPTLRILHLEDDTNDAELIRATLKEGGLDCTVDWVETRAQYEEALRENRCDIILSDYRVPGFDGLDALALAMKACPDVPFIFVSGTIGEERAIAAIKLGATDYVLKERLARLVTAVRRALQEVRERGERRAMEDRLRQSEEQFRLIAENMADLVAVVDVTGKRLYNSPSYRTLLGDPGRLQGSDSFAEIHPADRERIRQLFQETVTTGEGRRAEYRMIAHDGSVRYIESQGSVVRDGTGVISTIVIVSRDITQRKQLEEQLLHAQKMESIGTLAGGIAHDFNNILGIILGYASVLREDAGNPARLNRHLTAVIEAVQRGSSLVRQLLTFARKADVVFAPTRVNTVVDEVVHMCAETFPKTIDFVPRLDPSAPNISADRTQVHQALLNLCVNARDAMPHGGTITLSTSIAPSGEMTSRFPQAPEGSYVCIAITDTGTGMDGATRSRIFEPFFTTKGADMGTGLGLAIVYGVVKSHNAFVDVESELGKGTTFRLYFPAVPAHVEVPPAQESAAPEAAGGHETVLLVEDEEQLLVLAKLLLEGKGYTVLTARDGDEAVGVFRKHAGEIDLVLTDLGLPKLDGWQAYLQMKAIRPDTVAIVATGYADPRSKSDMLSQGVGNVIQKPYEPNILLHTVRQTLDDAKR
ncbi:MAG: response regulator [Bacteroidota bacterium]